MRLEFVDRHDPIWEVAPLRWDQGLMLGNGDIGAVIWGDGNPLKITLDKQDIWEHRHRDPFSDPRFNYRTLRELIGRERYEEAYEVFEGQFRDGGPYPTRLPLGRVEVEFGGRTVGFTARLSLRDALALGTLRLEDGRKVGFRAFVHSGRNLLVLELRGTEDFRFSARPPELGEREREVLRRWGYPEPEVGRDGEIGWWAQGMPEGGRYLVGWLVDGGAVYLTVVSHRQGDDPLRSAREVLEEARKLGVDFLFGEHVGWWHGFWEKSFISIPDGRLEDLWYIELYKLASCSRPGKLPVTLQGVWTVDGGLPPWSGDYHADMNVEESYWGIYPSNHLELGYPLYEMYWRTLPRWRKMCRKFFGVEGAHVWCAHADDGSPVPGWYTVNLWPGNGAWIARLFWLHWLYSRDVEFLRKRAFPFMREFLNLYLGILEKDDDGGYHIPLSTSPEWLDNRGEAWGKDTTCDLGLCRFLLKACIEAAQVLGEGDGEVQRWKEVLENLASYPQGPEGLYIMEGRPLTESHRHFSHLMPIHPLGLLTVEGDEEERELISRSISTLRRRGFGEWTGWSFPWASLIASRCGMGNMAHMMLKLYMDAFITENTFHINGDPKDTGISAFTYRTMTLEAGFCSIASVCEMLLQSWGGVIRVFPAIPDYWYDAYFADLRAEGAFLVSARLKGGKVTFVDVKSEAGGVGCATPSAGRRSLGCWRAANDGSWREIF